MTPTYRRRAPATSRLCRALLGCWLESQADAVDAIWHSYHDIIGHMETISVINVDPASRVVEEHVMVTNKALRIDEAVDAYLSFRERKNAAQSTLAGDTRLLKKFARDMNKIQIRHLTLESVGKWFAVLGAKKGHQQGGYNGVGHKAGGKLYPPIGPATHNQYRSRMKVFFDWMTKRGMTKVDLLEEVDVKPVPRRDRQQPKPGVLRSFLDSAVHPRDRAYLALAMNSALRASEVVRIRVGDVDLEGGYFKVTTSKRVDHDEMPITEDLEKELRRWFMAYEIDAGQPLLDGDYLFPNISAPRFDKWVTDPDTGTRVLLRTERRVERNTLHPENGSAWVQMGIQRTQDIVHRALKAAGLPTKYEGTHTIRRAVARAYFDSMRFSVGRDNALREVSALLHHSNSAMTERYLGLKEERDARNRAMRGKPFLSAMLGEDVEMVEVTSG